MDRHQKLLLGLGAGAIIGTAVGLLIAPKTGKESRKIVAERAGSIRRQAASTLRQAMKRRSSGLVEASPDYQAGVAG